MRVEKGIGIVQYHVNYNNFRIENIQILKQMI